MKAQRRMNHGVGDDCALTFNDAANTAINGGLPARAMLSRHQCSPAPQGVRTLVGLTLYARTPRPAMGV